MKLRASLLCLVLVVTLGSASPLLARGILFLREGSAKIIGPTRT